MNVGTTVERVMKMKEQILHEWNHMRIYDTHTHLSASHLAARGLHDVMLYHMVISELYSAGCPDGARLPEDVTDEEAAQRIERAIPYLPCIRNTAIYRLLCRILSDLYDWNEPITLENWRELDKRIREKYNHNDPAWAEEIFRRAGVKRAVTEYCRRDKGEFDHLLQYSLEWGFFARNQWGHNDAALLELEHAWEQDEPGLPLPVTAENLHFTRKIETVQDVYEAMEHYCSRIPVNDIVSTAQHISTDIHFRAVTEEEMEEALKNRENAGERERDIYASFVFQHFLKVYQEKCSKVIFQFSFGAEPLPFETGSKLRMESVFDIADFLAKNPNMEFQAMLSSAHQNQSICTLVREFPNFSVIGFWWHNFFPSYICRILEERLDMLPLNRQITCFSDAYCADWLYTKCLLLRELLAEVLAKRVSDGRYSFEEAVEIGKELLVKTPETLLKLK